MNDIYLYALKLLRRRELTVLKLRQKLAAKFGDVPPQIVDQLLRQNYVNDRRFAENHAARRKNRGVVTLRRELLENGVSDTIADEILSHIAWPSLHEALTARMNAWKLRPPLDSRDAARLFRALARLGYDEDALREEIEQLHDQQ